MDIIDIYTVNYSASIPVSIWSRTKYSNCGKSVHYSWQL